MKFDAVTKPIDRRFGYFIAVCATVALYPIYGISCERDAQFEGKNFVRQLVSEATDIIDNSPRPLLRLKAHILENTEFIPMAKYALGRHWKSANVKQRGEYTYLFAKTALHTLSQQILTFHRAKFEITRENALGGNQITVNSTFVGAKGAETQIHWRIMYKNCRPYIVDMVHDGVSLITTKRQEFDAVASKIGVSGLLTSLNQLEINQTREVALTDEEAIRAMLHQLVLEAAAKLKQQGR